MARFLRPISLSVAASAGIYLVAIVLADGPAVASRLRTLEAGFLGMVLALPTMAFLVRFFRWNLYLRGLGHSVPTLRHIQIYLAGFALTATPGKVGENLRAVYLRPFHVPIGHSVAAFTVERLVDLVAMLILSGFAFGLVGRYGWTLAATLALTSAGLLLLRHPGFTQMLLARADRTRLLGRAAGGVGPALGAARKLLSVRLLGAGIATALVAWSAEALTFTLVTWEIGIQVSLLTGVGIFAVATLLGAFSFLPGGVGATEGVMAGLLVLSGGSVPDSAAAILIVRVVTLWWAVLLGVIAVIGLGAPSTMQAVRPDETVE
jgi:uncharacterized membrane protein YbhN (UPF0104 family)